MKDWGGWTRIAVAITALSLLPGLLIGFDRAGEPIREDVVVGQGGDAWASASHEFKAHCANRIADPWGQFVSADGTDTVYCEPTFSAQVTAFVEPVASAALFAGCLVGFGALLGWIWRGFRRPA